MGWAMLVGLLGLLLFRPLVILADDENSSFVDFNRAVHAADPKLAEESFKKDHPNPPSKQEAEQVVTSIVNTALSVMDQAAEFEKRFPQSDRLAGIHDSRVNTLSKES
jgi:hypothetical protein